MLVTYKCNQAIYNAYMSTLDERRRLMLPVITKQTLYDDNQTHCFYTFFKIAEKNIINFILVIKYLH